MNDRTSVGLIDITLLLEGLKLLSAGLRLHALCMCLCVHLHVCVCLYSPSRNHPRWETMWRSLWICHACRIMPASAHGRPCLQPGGLSFQTSVRQPLVLTMFLMAFANRCSWLEADLHFQKAKAIPQNPEIDPVVPHTTNTAITSREGHPLQISVALRLTYACAHTRTIIHIYPHTRCLCLCSTPIDDVRMISVTGTHSADVVSLHVPLRQP